jgi:hypothetical protein
LSLSNSVVKKELSKRKLRKEFELDPRFPKQNAFINDTARFVSAQCSRRAGKTNGLAIRFFRTLEKYPKAQCVYLGLTRDSARDVMWPVLIELNDKYNLGCTFTESKLEMMHPNGATLKLYGADMKNFIKRLKGRKYPGVAIDETQDFGPHLESLIYDTLAPSIADYSDGWLAVTGTPGPVPQGFFFEVTHERKHGYSHHEWTVLDNPHMPGAAQYIEELKTQRGWDDNNPTLLREWRNRWVLDVQSLWVQYSAQRNHFDSLPSHKTAWNYIMGIDLGFKDADAIAILAWNESDPNTYLVDECITRKQGLTELVGQIKQYATKYQVTKMVIDEGGLGKKLAEEMRRQHHVPVTAADKMRKQETVEFLNDHLRLGRMKAKENSQFALDSYLVQIDWEKSTPSKIVVKKHPHSDIIDAVLYAFKESPAFTYQKPVPKPKAGTPEYYDELTAELEERALEHFTQLEEAELDPYGTWDGT